MPFSACWISTMLFSRSLSSPASISFALALQASIDSSVFCCSGRITTSGTPASAPSRSNRMLIASW
jgi:hypothetical protein